MVLKTGMARDAALSQDSLEVAKELQKQHAMGYTSVKSNRLSRRHATFDHSDVMTPNLFILGAAKCGTTSLFNILAQHPDIHASRVKEPSFFCSYFQVVYDPVTYFQLFDSAARYRMEASHVYISNPETPSILKALFPDARFIVTLRQPEQRAYALYRHMRRHVAEDGRPLEDIPTFAGALAAEADRFASKTFATNCRHYFWNYMYCRSSLYDAQLARYLALFDRSQFHVLSLAELAAQPAEATRRILRFLELDPSLAEGFVFPVANHGGAREPFCGESRELMNAAFEGLTDRIGDLMDQPLDWSM
jgi:hypothetical protein